MYLLTILCKLAQSYYTQKNVTFGYFSRYRTFGYQSVKYWGEFHHSFFIVICLNLLK